MTMIYKYTDTLKKELNGTRDRVFFGRFDEKYRSLHVQKCSLSGFVMKYIIYGRDSKDCYINWEHKCQFRESHLLPYLVDLSWIIEWSGGIIINFANTACVAARFY